MVTPVSGFFELVSITQQNSIVPLGLSTFTSFDVPLSHDHDPPRGWGQGTSAFVSNRE